MKQRGLIDALNPDASKENISWALHVTLEFTRVCFRWLLLNVSTLGAFTYGGAHRWSLKVHSLQVSAASSNHGLTGAY